MKKLIILTLTFIMALTLVLTLVPSVYADDGNVTVTLTSIFEEENTINIPIAVPNGSVLDISDFEGEVNFTFRFWVVNGVVKHNLTADASFLATDGLELIAVYSPNNNSIHPVIFIDTNGYLLELYFVEDDDSSTLPIANWEDFSKPGYTLVLDNDSPVWTSAIGSATPEVIHAASVFVLTYELTNPEAAVTINETSYPYNSLQTFTSIDIDFKYWSDEDGTVISYANPLIVSAIFDRTIVESTESSEATPVVYMLDVTGIRADHGSYLGQYYLPEGYEAVSFGFRVNEVYRQSNASHPTTNEFLLSIPDEAAAENVVAYLTYKYEGVLYTIHSETRLYVSTEEELQDALLIEGANIYLTNDIDLTKGIVVGQSGVSLDGRNYTLTFDALDNTNVASYMRHGILIGNGVSDVTIKNLTIDGYSDGYGILVHNGLNVTLQDITVSNASKGGIQINGAQVEVINPALYHNAWGGIEVYDGGSEPSLTITGAIDYVGIPLAVVWIDSKTTNDGWVTAPQLIEHIENGQLWFIIQHFAGGNGTEENPYLIEDADQLSNIKYHLNAYFKLIDDIDLTEIDWVPIAEVMVTIINPHQATIEVISAFSGELDGDNHSIIGLNAGSYTSDFGFALFAAIEGTVEKQAVVKNINFENVDIVVMNKGAAVIASSSNYVTYQNIQISGSMTAAAGASVTRIAYSKTKIIDVTSNLDIISNKTTVSSNDYSILGGLIEQIVAWPSEAIYIENSAFNGNITHLESSEVHTIAGLLFGQSIYLASSYGKVVVDGFTVSGSITGNDLSGAQFYGYTYQNQETKERYGADYGTTDYTLVGRNRGSVTFGA